MTTKKTKKQALPFKRRASYLAYPEDLYLEKKAGQKHYDPRVHHTFVERDVVWMLKPGHGVHKAVLVEKEGDRVTVVDGRQRVINLLEANRRLVAMGHPRKMLPVSPKRGDATSLFQIRVICNKHRQEDDPVTEAFLMSQYLNMGHNEQDCAELWGYTDRTVRNRIYLLELCPEVQQAVIAGDLQVTAAIRLRNLSRTEQIEALHRKPEPKKSRRPSPRKFKALLASNGTLPPPVRAAIQWANGEITDEQAAKQIKGFGRALEVSA